MIKSNAQKIPAKWLVVIVFALVVYGLGQPVVNRSLGWKLPSLGSLLGNEDHAQTIERQQPSTDTPAANRTASSEVGIPASSAAPPETNYAPNESAVRKTNASTAPPVTDVTTPTKPADSANRSVSTASTKSVASAQSPASSTPTASTQSAASTSSSSSKKTSATAQRTAEKDNGKLYGILTETGSENYVSPAGLRYTRGSEEGHRLKHLAKHLEDQPHRPGKHGVFNGDMPQVLRWLDEAYQRASASAKGTSKREENGRIVYEVSFTKPIGFIGGRDGARQKNPDAKRLRLVLDGDRVITAFPF